MSADDVILALAQDQLALAPLARADLLRDDALPARIDAVALGWGSLERYLDAVAALHPADRASEDLPAHAQALKRAQQAGAVVLYEAWRTLPPPAEHLPRLSALHAQAAALVARQAPDRGLPAVHRPADPAALREMLAARGEARQRAEGLAVEALALLRKADSVLSWMRVLQQVGTPPSPGALALAVCVGETVGSGLGPASHAALEALAEEELVGRLAGLDPLGSWLWGPALHPGHGAERLATLRRAAREPGPSQAAPPLRAVRAPALAERGAPAYGQEADAGETLDPKSRGLCQAIAGWRRGEVDLPAEALLLWPEGPAPGEAAPAVLRLGADWLAVAAGEDAIVTAGDRPAAHREAGLCLFPWPVAGTGTLVQVQEGPRRWRILVPREG